MKTKMSKRILTLVLALVLVFALSATAFAAYYSNNDATYTTSVTTYSTDQTIHVTLNFQSKKVGSDSINPSFDVELTGQTSYTVQDVVNTWRYSSAGADYTLTTLAYDADWNAIEVNFSDSSTYIYGITYNNINYKPSGLYDGWKFRVNTQIPYQPDGNGASIATAYVKNGDVIDFYYDNPTSASNTAKFTRIYDVSRSGSALSVTVQSSYDWFYYDDDLQIWVSDVQDFSAFSGTTVTITDGTNTYSTSNSVNGVYTFNNVPSGTYTIKVAVAYDNNGFIANTSSAINYIVS